MPRFWGQVSAFRADCDKLIDCFVSSATPNFQSFCTAWLNMHFQYVFYGYSTDHELVQFLEDAFLIVKHCFLKSITLLQQIGSVYLMYSMYYKQPTLQYIKYRFTVKEWIRFNEFYDKLVSGSEHDQARLIFWKLLKDNAFQFVEAEDEYGFERFMEKEHVRDITRSEYKEYNPVIAAELKSLQNESTGVVTALEILQVGYNEMKEHLDVAGPSTGSLPPTTIVSDIKLSMDKIQKYWKIGSAPKKNYELSSGSDEENSHDSEDVCTNIGSHRQKIKKNVWKSNQSPKERGTPAKSTQLATPPVASRRKKRNTAQELRRRTVQRELTVPVYVAPELERTSVLSSMNDGECSTIDLPNMPTQIL